MVGLSRVEIYSTTGKLLVSVNTKGNKIELNSSLDKGIYIVSAWNADGWAITERVLIKN